MLLFFLLAFVVLFIASLLPSFWARFPLYVVAFAALAWAHYGLSVMDGFLEGLGGGPSGRPHVLAAVIGYVVAAVWILAVETLRARSGGELFPDEAPPQTTSKRNPEA